MTAPVTVAVTPTAPVAVTVQRSDAPPVTVAVSRPPAVNLSVGGLRGLRGLQGIQGPAGPAGSDPVVYAFTNAATWTITHALGRYPVVELIDQSGAVFDADLEFPDLNTAVATHAAPLTGSALVS